MIIKKGTLVGTVFGEGEVVAVTKEWVVVQCWREYRRRSSVAPEDEQSGWCQVAMKRGGGDEVF